MEYKTLTGGFISLKDDENKEGELKEAIDKISMIFFNFIKYYFYKISKSIGKPIESPVLDYM